MYPGASIALLLLMPLYWAAPSPFRFAIDCSSEERESYGRSPGNHRRLSTNSRFDINSFCNLIHSAIPDGIKDGHFILDDMDQSGQSDTQDLISVAPPQGFIQKFALSKFKTPKLKVPKLKVPTLRAQGDFPAPRVGRPMKFPMFRNSEEESSAERMEIFKKGVQKMLHVVKVMGQIDEYLSQRTRIVIDKLTKTFAD